MFQEPTETDVLEKQTDKGKKKQEREREKERERGMQACRH